jgi:hypothetical protein
VPTVGAGTHIIPIYATDGEDVTSQIFALKAAGEGGNGGGDGDGGGIDTWASVLLVHERSSEIIGTPIIRLSCYIFYL